MNKRVCFIGDSHVAALRLAINSERGEKYRSSMDIFGSRGKGLRSIRIENDLIVSDDETVTESFRLTGGADQIDLKKYDAFCIAGCLGNWVVLENIFSQFSTTRMKIGGDMLASDRFVDALLAERLKQTLAYEVIERLAKATRKPLYYIKNPFFSAKILEHRKGAFLRQAISAGATEILAARIEAAIDLTLGKHATVITQPPETIEMHCFTKDIFSQGSVRLSQRAPEHKGDDFGHMNAEFGLLVLEAAFAKIFPTVD